MVTLIASCCFSGGEFIGIKDDLRSRGIKLVLKGGRHKAAFAEQAISMNTF
jgi:hypothetical protein